ncbi:helix-turn-helix domain-containing protein [Pseudomonas syringae group sp. 247E2]|uniref:helix-turn-helix domain-containing protein n=1 Tax=Pseudomonas syringae group sp. 247E2 TaxID=3079592 RepID=UPI002912EA05|nr:helix-turn-helix domain-containing protein [Pseudomonas syringae group sp. 247E2]MDU8605983.1 helix-turn-helix domain-containing protein [Pseudomonas syringae group sp. 247E2]
MPGKKTTPDQSTQVVILREAGYTLPVIADRLDLSISTVQRIIKTTKAVAGAGTQALIDKAREDLLSSAFSLDAVQQTVATLVADELALSHLIRTKIANALEALDPTDPVAFRGLAAASTALKLTQDVTRRSLPIEKLNQAQDIEELPTLQIHILTENDVAEMRAKQRLEEAEMNGDAQGIEDEIANLEWMERRRLAKSDQSDEDDDVVCEGFDLHMTGT